MNARDLAGLDNRALGALMAGGHAIDPATLDDTEYRGVSLGLPGVVERFTWKTFVKAFHRDPVTGALRGWNVRIRQDHPERYQPMQRRGRPHTFGHFAVVPARGRPMPRPFDRGLLLDYGLGKRSRFETTGALRDPIVALEPGSVELLLGWTYLDLGIKRVATPSFFTLERDRTLTHVP